METKNVRKMFERAADKKHVCGNNPESCEHLQYKGIERFVSAIFGWHFFTKKRDYTLDQLAETLVKLGIAPDINDGRGKVFTIEGVQLNYGNFRYVNVERVSKTDLGLYSVYRGRF